MIVFQTYIPSYFEFNSNNSSFFNYPKLIDSIEYLNHFTKDCPSKILTDPDAYHALLFIGKSICLFKRQVNYESFAANNFAEIFPRLLTFFYQSRYELRLESRSETRTQIFTYLTFVINAMLLQSTKFCRLFVQSSGLEACLGFLEDEKFVNANKNVRLYVEGYEPSELTEHFTMFLTNLVITCDEFKPKWIGLGAVKTLLNTVKLKPDTLFNAYTTLAFILNEAQIKDLGEIGSIIEVISKLLMQGKLDFEQDDLNRNQFQIVFKGKPAEFSIHHVDRGNGSEISVDYLLDCLFKVSVSDKTKSQIYFREGMKSCLKTYLEKGWTLFLLVFLSYLVKLMKKQK